MIKSCHESLPSGWEFVEPVKKISCTSDDGTTTNGFSSTNNRPSTLNGLKPSRSFTETSKLTLSGRMSESVMANKYVRRLSDVFYSGSGSSSNTDGMRETESSLRKSHSLRTYFSSGNWRTGLSVRSVASHMEQRLVHYSSLARSTCDGWLSPDEVGWLARRNSTIDRVKLMDSHDSGVTVDGKFHVTLSHLIFHSADQTREIWILINLIKSMDTSQFSSMGKSLLIRCKDFRVYKFMVEDSVCCERLKTVLLKLIDSIDQHNKLPCFMNGYNKKLPQILGWQDPVKRLENSFRRMGIEGSQWKFTDVNKDYKISDTYPSVLVVPATVTKATMEACAKFRSRGRLPALTYYHKPSGTGLCRCSQPLVGFSARCQEDIDMLKRIKDALSNPYSVSPGNSGGQRLHVVDTRPRINAFTNKAKGKGYESDLDYEQIDFQFFDIENIHVMRASLDKMLKACRNPSQSFSSYLNAVEKSSWLKHIRLILETSFYIAQKMLSGENVLVHCSDGWDRTSQVSGLTQVILDPFYRTIAGLEDLIEKDWLAFGHKFGDRCGQLSSVEASEVAPVFTQFLDCLYQLSRCYSSQFEYGERLLVHIQRWSRGCELGTFVGNCQKDRLDLRLHENTKSVWGYINICREEYLNPYYDPDNIIAVLPRQLRVTEFRIWSAMYSPAEEVRAGNLASSSGGGNGFVNVGDHILNTTWLCDSIRFQNRVLLRQARLLMDRLGPVKYNDKCSKDANQYQSQVDDVVRDLLELGEESESEKPTIEGEEENEPEQIMLRLPRMLEEIDSVCPEFCHGSGVLRGHTQCQGCGHHFFSADVRKRPCFSCGRVFCSHCISASIPLPGHGTDLASSFSFSACVACHTRWAPNTAYSNLALCSPVDSPKSKSEPVSLENSLSYADPLLSFVTPTNEP